MYTENKALPISTVFTRRSRPMRRKVPLRYKIRA